jgi:hypothetical protein
MIQSMKRTILIAMLAFAGLLACNKTLRDQTDPGQRSPGQDSVSSPINDTIPPFPFQTIIHNAATGSQPASCPLLSLYGDSIVFPQPTSGDNIISPVNSKGSGKYFAWPAGLSLDQGSGAINLTKSQAGMRYAIGYVPSGTHDTCISPLIVAGAAYLDSAYNLGGSDTLARPYFNGNGGLLSTCATPGACSFDYDGNAAASGVTVDQATGVIHLAKLTGNGKGQFKDLFGGNPVNGATAIVPISYKINDGSGNAPQQISVEFMYYDAKSQIPATLLSSMQAKAFSAIANQLISTSLSPRPPLIIVTRKF